jgi:hypothetical protein
LCPELNQLLTGFFTFFSLDERNKETLLRAFFVVLRSLKAAPVYSSLKTIDTHEVARTMLDMIQNLDRRFDATDENPCQESLAFSCLTEIQNPENKEDSVGKLYTKILLMLELPKTKFVAVRAIKEAASTTKEVKNIFVHLLMHI